MFCEKCKQEIAENSEFCKFCGAKQLNNEIEEVLATEEVEDGLTREILLEWEYNHSKKRLIIRGVSLALFFIIGLINSIISKQFLSILTVVIPLSFWGSILAVYLFKDGIKEFFLKIWHAISAAIAFIAVSFLYGIVILIALILGLLVLAAVLAIFGRFIPDWLALAVGFIIWYSGAVISIIGGIKDYISIAGYKKHIEF